MIDNISICLKNFEGVEDNFKNCDYQGMSYKTKVYRLYNHEGKDKKIYLLVKYNKEKKTLSIDNSIRKWLLGGFFLLDLTEKRANDAFERLAYLLNISISDLYEANFTNCELGLTLNLRIPMEQLEPLIVRYSTYKRYCYEGKTVGFLGVDRELKIYDKYQELVDKNRTYDKLAKRNTLNAFKRQNYRFVRAELTMIDNQSFINSHLGCIRNIGDLLRHYQYLYYFWANELSKVFLVNKLVMNKSMTSRQYMIARVLENEGYSSFKINCLERSRGKEKGCLQDDLEKVVNVYGDKRVYNTETFRADIYRNLERIKDKGENIDMEELKKILYDETDFRDAFINRK